MQQNPYQSPAAELKREPAKLQSIRRSILIGARVGTAAGVIYSIVAVCYVWAKAPEILEEKHFGGFIFEAMIGIVLPLAVVGAVSGLMVGWVRRIVSSLRAPPPTTLA